ncbi:MAG: hypothetical protein MUO39_12110 [Steroidobacteraceae bacterium]|nr:hypothetical protein [Steroidobacteraceae bacterium]
MSTHSGRITGPVLYQAEGGYQVSIPLGPCLVDQVDDRSIDIVWGALGQNSAALPVTAVKAALVDGDLMLLD